MPTEDASPPSAGAASPRPVQDLVLLSARDLARTIRSRQVSCVEVMQAFLDHIDRFNPQVNAIVSLQDRDGLVRQATERDRQLARGQWLGWMHGFPQAPKDLALTAGIPTTWGSPLFRDFVPQADAIIVGRARRSGAILIGKTNVPEFGLGSQTYNPVFGPTGNAYDPARTAGGSSGGAAAALALRMLPVADGSDMMGSLRNPAAYNNVIGFRPSFGRVPYGPTLEGFVQQLGYEGPMGRTVTDVALLLSVQAGYDERSPLSIHQDPARFAEPLRRDVSGARLAWLGDLGGYLPMEPGILELCQNAFRVFESIGCAVEPTLPDYP
ncbi:MAG: amidase, partial [Pseudomonadota bacterium]|nr:amidase [Pseudomonadota bacterium]